MPQYPAPKHQYGDFSKAFLLLIVAIFSVFAFFYFMYVPSGRHKTFVGVGASMAPTFSDGDKIVVDTKAVPSAGDAIVFDCIKCEGVLEPETMTKRIHQISQTGCFWLVGDNDEISYDSRSTGWLCPQEHIFVHGVVVGVEQ